MRATVGIVEAARQQTGSDPVFFVKGHGKVLRMSIPIRQKHEAEACEATLAETQLLTLEVRCANDPRWAFAIWGGPQVLGK
jgi:hypothetical protein